MTLPQLQVYPSGPNVIQFRLDLGDSLELDGARILKFFDQHLAFRECAENGRELFACHVCGFGASSGLASHRMSWLPRQYRTAELASIKALPARDHAALI
jgi:hypothetical protein